MTTTARRSNPPVTDHQHPAPLANQLTTTIIVQSSTGNAVGHVNFDRRYFVDPGYRELVQS